MGITTWPCRECGQAQIQEHANGTEVETRLCAACEEKHRNAEVASKGKADR